MMFCLIAPNYAGAENSYVRKTDDLETAIKTFQITSPDAPSRRLTTAANGKITSTVALVGAIHIGDKSYYDELQTRLDSYDTVLFELVTEAPLDRLPANTVRGSSTLGGIQRQLASYLGLVHQLDAIDYSKPRMLRADMTSGELSEVMVKRDESFLKLYLKALTLQSDNQPATGVAELAMMFFPGTRSMQLRKTFADQFANLDQFLDAFGGGENIALISARNDVALASLRNQLTIHPGRKIAIFYGAAHMRDIERKLTAEFKAVPVGVEWIPAWNLSGKTKP